MQWRQIAAAIVETLLRRIALKQSAACEKRCRGGRTAPAKVLYQKSKSLMLSGVKVKVS